MELIKLSKIMIFLIDFDGTCVPQLPEPGYCEVETGAEEVLKDIVIAGHRIVLWTARNNSRNNPFNYSAGRFRTETSLEEAERWFKEREIPLYGVNEHDMEEEMIGYSRKAVGDFLIDDTAIGTPLVWGEVEYASYDTGEIKKIYTHCVDWSKIKTILIEMKLI